MLYHSEVIQNNGPGHRTINIQAFPWYENGEVLLDWEVQDLTKQTFLIGSRLKKELIPKIILQTSPKPYAPYPGMY